MEAIFVVMGKRPRSGEIVINVAIAIHANFRVPTMKVVSNIVRIPIQDYIGLPTFTVVENIVRSPMQFSTTKTLTTQLLESEWC